MATVASRPPDVVKRETSLLKVSLGVYAACGNGAVGSNVLPRAAQESIFPYFWLLGPSANLVFGANFLWPYVIGTLIMALLAYAGVRAQSTAARVVCGVAGALTWALGGFMVYAPGA